MKCGAWVACSDCWRFGVGLTMLWPSGFLPRSAVVTPGASWRKWSSGFCPVSRGSGSPCRVQELWPYAAFLGQRAVFDPRAPVSGSFGDRTRDDSPWLQLRRWPIQRVASSVRPSGCPFVEGCWWGFPVAAFQPVLPCWEGGRPRCSAPAGRS